jgi:hypothetical protein
MPLIRTNLFTMTSKIGSGVTSLNIRAQREGEHYIFKIVSLDGDGVR